MVLCVDDDSGEDLGEPFVVSLESGSDEWDLGPFDVGRVRWIDGGWYEKICQWNSVGPDNLTQVTFEGHQEQSELRARRHLWCVPFSLGYVELHLPEVLPHVVDPRPVDVLHSLSEVGEDHRVPVGTEQSVVVDERLYEE